MNEALLFGAIADDYTGGSDLAGMLSGQGVPTVLILGIQPEEFVASLKGRYRAAVIALKSRSIPSIEARALSLRALTQLRNLQARQIQFKYCSTFDSTRQGNIGPVIEALMEAMSIDFTVAVPALPINQRTQYMGYLFVGQQLLSESHMRYHPVTPMTDANLVRHLQAQMTKRVGLIAYPAVRGGESSIRAEVARLKAEGVAAALVDVLSDIDLEQISQAVVDLPLITGGSGLAMKLPSAWSKKGWLPLNYHPEWTHRAGAKPVLIISGSCSAMTLQQIELLKRAGCPSMRLNVSRLLSGEREAELSGLNAQLTGWLQEMGWALVYSSAGPQEREDLFKTTETRGITPEQVSLTIERSTGELVKKLVEQSGVSNLIIAGGETTGAVMEALKIPALEVGETLDPGVPVCRSLGDHQLALVFKSGNFGSPDFFIKATRHLRGERHQIVCRETTHQLDCNA